MCSPVAAQMRCTDAPRYVPTKGWQQSQQPPAKGCQQLIPSSQRIMVSALARDFTPRGILAIVNFSAILYGYSHRELGDLP